jgi:hypothetical protein
MGGGAVMDEQKLEQLWNAATAATPGPWYHCQPFMTVPKQMTIHGSVLAARVDFVSTNPEPVHQKLIINMPGRESCTSSEDMAHIAAASPDTILELIRELRVRGRALEIAAKELMYRPDAAESWHAQAERELGEKHGE